MESLEIINARYTATAVKKEQYPAEQLPEIAFLGRSNVGKSSLINSLCNYKGLARVSGAPGKTQTINYYRAELRAVGEEVRHPFYLVDLPGYGYAKTGIKQREMWSHFIREYVQTSPSLRLLCLLVDSRHPGLEIDIQAYEWLITSSVKVQLIATKADKLKAKERQKNMSLYKEIFSQTETPILYSSLKRQGSQLVLQRCLEHLA
ncbi:MULTISPECIES: ribosome biogenesis GTP-binding protein YihA/YsxC [Megasphaera]|uniref:Probable GTP-binding protein EngB n=1 Tax=Megasphaera hutchinsoni TaxID=1588748 RepID=A0A134CF25_9FIRM|nr:MULTISPECIES: ribosome biogenesis GTP-binding protein YihA/YsxC [Megasphaera]EGS35621.1 ribosome biogenesis GTP-binding protein YsxC [Megasphaera sp. UPII 135-E]KXB90823.1 ribosome biogenesis GTP-binding protein YsxC [Megasphaera hutchinsoni]MUP59359.1 YihA family ribosome biogenesis GTP-binding protein [Veillonellaceae bacterium M2-4]